VDFTLFRWRHLGVGLATDCRAVGRGEGWGSSTFPDGLEMEDILVATAARTQNILHSDERLGGCQRPMAAQPAQQGAQSILLLCNLNGVKICRFFGVSFGHAGTGGVVVGGPRSRTVTLPPARIAPGARSSLASSRQTLEFPFERRNAGWHNTGRFRLAAPTREVRGDLAVSSLARLPRSHKICALDP
jgi:hypothetical protein